MIIAAMGIPTIIPRRPITSAPANAAKIMKIGLMFKNVDVDANVFFTSMVITQEIKSGVRRPDDVPDYLKHF